MLKVGDKLDLPEYGECKVTNVYKKSYWGEKNEPTYILKPEKPRFSLQRIELDSQKARKFGVKNFYSALFLLIVLSVTGCATGIPLNPSYSNADSAYKHKNYTEAAKYYEQFLQENPQSTLVEVSLFYLGQSYQETGEKEKAKEAYGKLIDKYKSGFWVDTAKKELKNLN